MALVYESQPPGRMGRAVAIAEQLRQELQTLSDDCWQDDNTVRLTPQLAELRQLIDSVALLQEPLNEISAAAIDTTPLRGSY